MDFLASFLAVAEKVGLLFLLIFLGFICWRHLKISGLISVWGCDFGLSR